MDVKYIFREESRRNDIVIICRDKGIIIKEIMDIPSDGIEGIIQIGINDSTVADFTLASIYFVAYDAIGDRERRSFLSILRIY